MLFVVLLDLRQGLIVLKSGFFSIIWHVVGNGQGGGGLGLCVSPRGGENFCWGGGGPTGGDGTLWGCDPPVGVSWQLCRMYGRWGTKSGNFRINLSTYSQGPSTIPSEITVSPF